MKKCVDNYGHLLDGSTNEKLVAEIQYYVELEKLSKVTLIADALVVTKDLPSVNFEIDLTWKPYQLQMRKKRESFFQFWN